MRESADVRSLEAIRLFRAALIEFAENAKLALTEAIADVNKTVWWLQQDRMAYWSGEIRRRNDKVQQAKSDLYRAELQSRDTRPSCVVQRKALQRAKDAMEEAERKLAATKRWIQNMERESLLFKAALNQISSAVELEVPAACAKMNAMIEALEAYVRLSVGPSDGGKRGGELAPDLQSLLPEAISSVEAPGDGAGDASSGSSPTEASS